MRRSDVGYEVAHFERARVLFAAGQLDLATRTHELFLDGVTRALAFLSLPDEFPFANLFLAPSRAEFDRLVAHLTRTPTDTWRVGQPQGHDLVLLSPEAYPADAAPAWLGPDGLCDESQFARLVVHETVHMVEECFSPRPAMECRPAWWSEGLAVLVSGQHRLDPDLRARMRADLEAGVIPALEELRGGPAYSWAWAAVECLLRTVGEERFTEMLTGSCAADILGALEVERERFERDWHAHAVAEARAFLG